MGYGRPSREKCRLCNSANYYASFPVKDGVTFKICYTCLEGLKKLFLNSANNNMREMITIGRDIDDLKSELVNLRTLIEDVQVGISKNTILVSPATLKSSSWKYKIENRLGKMANVK